VGRERERERGGGEKGIAYMIFVVKPKKKETAWKTWLWEMIILKLFSNKFYGRLWTGFVYFRIGKNVYIIYTSGCIKCEDFLAWLISLLGFSKTALLFLFNWELI
jgi:hypothetical protein